MSACAPHRAARRTLSRRFSLGARRMPRRQKSRVHPTM